jgi:hypothetical protein
MKGLCKRNWQLLVVPVAAMRRNSMVDRDPATQKCIHYIAGIINVHLIRLVQAANPITRRRQFYRKNVFRKNP